jgi:hypothetical protein
VAKLLKRKTTPLGAAPIVILDSLFLSCGQLAALFRALFAGHKPARSEALEAITCRDVAECLDLAFAAALETFEGIGHLLAPLLMNRT